MLLRGSCIHPRDLRIATKTPALGPAPPGCFRSDMLLQLGLAQRAILLQRFNTWLKSSEHRRALGFLLRSASACESPTQPVEERTETSPAETETTSVFSPDKILSKTRGVRAEGAHQFTSHGCARDRHNAFFTAATPQPIRHKAAHENCPAAGARSGLHQKKPTASKNFALLPRMDRPYVNPPVAARSARVLCQSFWIGSPASLP